MIEDRRIERALVVRPEASPMLMLELQHADGSFGVFARHEEQPWERHGVGRVLANARYERRTVLDLDTLARELDRELELEDVYASLRALGLDYGPEFRRLASLQVGTDAAGGTRMLSRLRADGLDSPAQ